MTSVCPGCGALVEHDRMENRREWVPIPGTDKVRLIVDGEVVHECESFERNGT